MYKAKLNNRELSLELPEDGLAVVDGKKVCYDLKPIGNGEWHLIAGTRSYEVRLVGKDEEAKSVTLLVNNRSYIISLRDEFDELLDKMGMSAAAGAKMNELKAPMPGLVVSVAVNPGDEVKKGDPVLILEAMKMENVIKAAGDATVQSIHVEKGQTVEKNQLLISFG